MKQNDAISTTHHPLVVEIKEKLNSCPEQLPRMNHKDSNWSTAWSVLLDRAPEDTADFIRATSVNADMPANEVLLELLQVKGARSLANFREAMGVLLDLIKVQEPRDVYAGAITRVVSVVLHDMVFEQKIPNSLEALELLAEQHDLAHRCDLGAGKRHFTHLLVSDAIASAKQIQEKKMGQDWMDQYVAATRKLFGEILILVTSRSGSLEHPVSLHLMGTNDILHVKSPLEQACHLHDTLPCGEAIIGALLDQGASWKRVVERWQEGAAKTLVEHHPRVMQERLEAIAQENRGLISETTTPHKRKL